MSAISAEPKMSAISAEPKMSAISATAKTKSRDASELRPSTSILLSPELRSSTKTRSATAKTKSRDASGLRSSAKSRSATAKTACVKTINLTITLQNSCPEQCLIPL